MENRFGVRYGPERLFCTTTMMMFISIVPSYHQHDRKNQQNLSTVQLRADGELVVLLNGVKQAIEILRCP